MRFGATLSDPIASNHLILKGFNDAAKRVVYSLQEFFTLAGKAAVPLT